MTEEQNQAEGTSTAVGVASSSSAVALPPESPTPSVNTIEVLHQQGSLLDNNLDDAPPTPTINNVSITINDEHDDKNDISTMSGPIQTVVPPLPSPNRRIRHASNNSWRGRDDGEEVENQETQESESSREGNSDGNGNKKKKERWPFWYFVSLLLVDLNAAIVLFLPIFPWYARQHLSIVLFISCNVFIASCISKFLKLCTICHFCCHHINPSIGYTIHKVNQIVKRHHPFFIFLWIVQ